MFEDILFEKTDGVARVTLNRSRQLNAFRGQTLDELIEALRQIEADPTVGVVVLTGAGERAFSSGADIKENAGASAEQLHHLALTRNLPLGLLMRQLSKPIIAAIRGYAAVGGVELALFCDLRLAAEDARLRIADEGITPYWGTAQLLARLVGEGVARELMFLAREIDGREAARLGLVNRAVPAADLDREVAAWCQRILQRSPGANELAKLALNYDTDLLYGGFVQSAALAQAYYRTPQLQEFLAAFREKRAPDFRRFRA
ncbi:MAG: enoyl-CoA hydratase/isomerase family protein [Chloroflexi bacterium]|nr:enoyl-CoA hydratase/isomerase family protein [Chloroflexota bacterium]